MKEFSFNTINNFDDHIMKSIPNYDVLINTILSMSEYFLEKGTNIYDLGCSTGKLLKSLPNSNENNKIGYDNASLMPESNENIEFKVVNLNNEFSIINACLVYSVFTMQFLNRINRLNYCKTIYEGLNEGGALFLCEKIYQLDGLLQEILTFSHYDYKKNHFTDEEIYAKEHDLRFIMKPNRQGENELLLKEAGFSTVTQFWQSYNFIGLIAIK